MEGTSHINSKLQRGIKETITIVNVAGCNGAQIWSIFGYHFIDKESRLKDIAIILFRGCLCT